MPIDFVLRIKTLINRRITLDVLAEELPTRYGLSPTDLDFVIMMFVALYSS